MSQEASRIQDLEIRVTFLDDAVAALSTADAGMVQRMRAIETALGMLREELEALRSASGHDPHSEPPPPHY